FAGEETGSVGATIIGSAAPAMNFVIYCQDGMELSDLPGTRLAISSPDGGHAIIAQAMLSAADIDPDSITYFNAGDNTERYRAVVQGSVDAAASPQDYIPRADADGVSICAESIDLIPDYPRWAIIAS